MKLKLKSLVAALAMASAGGANAAISTDGVFGGAGLTLGTGDGEIFFAINDPTLQQSLVLDLNLTVNDFRFNNASLINTFSVTDATLASFIANSPDQSLLEWNLGGLSNKGLGPDLGVVSTHGSAGATWDLGEGFLNGHALTGGMVLMDGFAGFNPSTTVVASTSAGGFNGGIWGATYGGAMQTLNSHTGLLGGELMSFHFADETNTLDGLVMATAFTGGLWVVDGALGKVSYNAVPVPAAVWLFGSALLGLIGISRRRG